MTQKDVDRVLLALYAVREAGPRGSLEQCKAICYCLRNRVRAGWGDWMSVIESADEVHAHAAPEAAWLDANNRTYQRLLRDVDDIYFGHSSPRFGDESDSGDLESSLCAEDHLCLYWAFLNRPMRPEFVETIARDVKNHPSRVTMGLMMFYE